MKKDDRPLQYILGNTEFMGLELKVTPAVLIPRPETEILVERVMKIASGIKAGPVEILDLGTGSGNIAISLACLLEKQSIAAILPGQALTCAKELTKPVTTCKIMASDVSEAALLVAQENAQQNGILGQIEFVKSDLFSNLPSGKRFDIIVSNPPYVAEHEFAWLQKEISFEPKLALDGGSDGLGFYRRIIKEAPAYLKKNGFLVFEIGFSQGIAVRAMLKENLFDKIESIKDYNYITRVVTARWTN